MYRTYIVGGAVAATAAACRHHSVIWSTPHRGDAGVDVGGGVNIASRSDGARGRWRGWSWRWRRRGGDGTGVDGG